MKRRKHFDPLTNSKNGGYSAVEIFEEDSHDEDQFKLNPFYLLYVFYSLLDVGIKNALKRITPFNKHFSYSSSNRYLEYRVFRI